MKYFNLTGLTSKLSDLLFEIERISLKHEEIFLQRANIYSKKDHSNAIHLLEKALDLTDEPFEIWSLLGMEHLFWKTTIKLKNTFTKCVKNNVLDYSSLYNLLHCNEQVGQYTESISVLNDLLEINPYSEVAWHQLGKVYIKLNKPEEAHFLHLNLP